MSAMRAALVIARRDYVASVWSRTFLFFLIGPLLPLLFGGGFALLGAKADRAEGPPAIAVLLAARETTALTDARSLIVERLGDGAVPRLLPVTPTRHVDVQARRLLRDGGNGAVAVLSGTLDQPVLTGPRAILAQQRGAIGLMLDGARGQMLLVLFPDGDGAADYQRPVAITERPVDAAAGADSRTRATTARTAQFVLMFLTLLLTGMMLSNMVEEKSNKVIEVLTAAVPVDAIFFGKLLAMLGLSLTGIAVWGAAGAAGFAAMTAANPVSAPAVGWAMFGALGLVYFALLYLLIGSLYLGVGAQAASVREVQTLSMPLTMAQLGLVALASLARAEPDGALGIAAAVFPWSSPFVMLARAATDDALWPHLVAILWQLLWVGLTVRAAAGWFRRSVLKSGGPGPIARLFRRVRRRPISEP